jgi:hypothetical protein
MLAGCNAILGIEKASVDRGGSLMPACAEGDDAGDACVAPCSSNEECAPGDVCESGVCQSAGMDSGIDSGRDGAVESAVDGNVDGTLGSDAAPDADAAPVECTLPCDEKSRCAVTNGVPTCVCANGYQGESGACMDIDECMQTDRGGCSANADCKNTEGSRVCTCKEGFQDGKGDGTECVSKCAAVGCDLNAICSIVDGAAKCQCTGAYSGDGMTCTYNPSCAALTCGANTTCGLKTGSTTSYECKCQTGYEPDASAGASLACKDIDDCKLVPGVCAATNHSSCENNQGGFNCPCVSGYRKNALGACEDIPDCPANACAGGMCVDAVNDYSCSCNAGYTPATDGKSCVDARNDCPANACTGGTCRDGVNAYSCTCNAGYTVSSDQRSCIENNECVPNPCAHGACSDKVNDFACDCTGTGFIGKDCSMRSQGCSSGIGTSCTVGVNECANTGVWQCDPNGTMLVCSVSAKPATAEKCDGKDNDCDGVADQTFTQMLNQPCFNGTGACRGQGITICKADGTGVECNARTGSPAANDASCNNIDDDCKEGVDEDYVQTATTCGVGECSSTGSTRCVGGVVQDTCVKRAASAEICDGKDNDCMNGVDDGFNLNAACTNGLPGECVRGGIRVCSGNVAVCNAPGATGTTEICNGKDDDCDGTKDDGVPATCKNEGAQFVCNMSTGVTGESPCSNTTSCLNGACIGSCRFNRDFTCVSGNSHSCQQNGTYSLSQTCNPSLPERCENRAGQAQFGHCVPNQPFVMCANGAESPTADCLGTATRPYTIGAIVAQPFIPTESVRVTQFGARTGSGTSGCSAYLSLHANASGQPGAIMNSTGLRTLNSDSLNLTTPNSASDASTKLTAGVTYWLVARIGGAGTCTIQYVTANVAAGPYRRGDATDFFAPDNMTPGMTSPVASGGEVKLFIQAQR